MKTDTANIASKHIRRIRNAVILFILLTIAPLFSSGCATVGKDFPAIKVSEIKIGKTTQDEIRSMFGSPWRIGIEDGQRTWTYGNYHYGLFVEKKARDLLIRFDKNNVVTSYTYSTTEHTE